MPESYEEWAALRDGCAALSQWFQGRQAPGYFATIGIRFDTAADAHQITLCVTRFVGIYVADLSWPLFTCPRGSSADAIKRLLDQCKEQAHG